MKVLSVLSIFILMMTSLSLRADSEDNRQKTLTTCNSQAINQIVKEFGEDYGIVEENVEIRDSYIAFNDGYRANVTFEVNGNKYMVRVHAYSKVNYFQSCGILGIGTSKPSLVTAE